MVITGAGLNLPQLAALQKVLRSGAGLPIDPTTTWAWRVGPELVGYAALLPVPGLPRLLTLHGGVRPAWRRQGIGGRLMAAARAGLAQAGGGTMECGLDAKDGAGALFLRAQGFRPGHEELFLRRSLTERLPAVPIPAGWRVENVPRSQAGSWLRSLYDASFREHPWYQPFVSDADVDAELDDPADLLFGLLANRPVAFAWIRANEVPAVIEPFGVLPALQGQGLGGVMLSAALARLQERGAGAVSIGAWRQNSAALRLYRRLGFAAWFGRTYFTGTAEPDGSQL